MSEHFEHNYNYGTASPSAMSHVMPSSRTDCPCLDEPPDFVSRPPPKFFLDGDLDFEATCFSDQFWTSVQDVTIIRPVNAKKSEEPSFIFLFIAVGAAIGTLLLFGFCFLLWQRFAWCKRCRTARVTKIEQPSTVTDIDANSLAYSGTFLPKSEWLLSGRCNSNVLNRCFPVCGAQPLQYNILPKGHCHLVQRPLPDLPPQYAQQPQNVLAKRCKTPYDNYNLTYEEISLNRYRPTADYGTHSLVYCSGAYNVVEPGHVAAADPGPESFKHHLKQQNESICSCSCGSMSIPDSRNQSISAKDNTGQYVYCSTSCYPLNFETDSNLFNNSNPYSSSENTKLANHNHSKINDRSIIQTDAFFDQHHKKINDSDVLAVEDSNSQNIEGRESGYCTEGCHGAGSSGSGGRNNPNKKLSSATIWSNKPSDQKNEPNRNGKKRFAHSDIMCLEGPLQNHYHDASISNQSSSNRLQIFPNHNSHAKSAYV